MNLIDCFPKGYTPRKGQEYILDQVQKHIDNKQRFIIIESPTGTGKSHLSSTFSAYSRDCSIDYKRLVSENKIFERDSSGFKYADMVEDMGPWGCTSLTVTKHLQDQYSDLFTESAILKGKNEYGCSIDPDVTVDVGPCTYSSRQLTTCLSSDTCEYYNNLKSSLTNKFSILNYNKFMTTPKFVRDREFLVCDEASEVEDMIVAYNSITIDYDRLDKLDISYKTKVTKDNSRANYEWLYNILQDIIEKLPEIQKAIQSKYTEKKTKALIIKKYQTYKTLKERLAIILNSYNSCEYICQFTGDNVTFMPLYVNTLSNDLWGNNKHIILMSGTIFDPETYARCLGIKDYAYIEVDSEFDNEKNPIYVPGKYALNYKTQDRVLPKILDQALDILDDNKGVKGIIHTHTNNITTELKKRTNNSRLLYRSQHVTNENILLDHITRDDDTVLVSPSMALGVDLPDDLSRFQIIIKLPFLSLANKRVKALFDRDKKWYTMKMLVKLIQMAGRSSRNKDDYSVTYILDGAALNILKKEWNRLPIHFKNRLK